MKSYFSLTLLALFLITSCGKNNDEAVIEATPFIGAWELTGIIYQGDIAMFIPDDTVITLKFQDTGEEVTFEGQSTCNSYLGRGVRITQTTISFSTFGMTEVACLDQDLESFEANYFDFLRDVKYYSLENGGLTLSFNNTFMMYKRAED